MQAAQKIKNQVPSLSCLTNKVNWQQCAAKNIFKNLQRGTYGRGGEGTEN